MHEGGFFYQAFVYMSAAVVSVPLAKKLGLGSVLGYLIAGIVIGPYVIGLIGEEGQDVMHFAEFGVVMMLFLVGLELQPSLLWKLRAPILGLGGMQVTITAGIIMAIALLATPLAWQTALAIGLTLALSSTAIVLQTLNEKGQMKSEGGQNAFSVLLFQDIAVIPILAIFPLLAITDGAASGHHDHALWIDHFPIAIKTAIVLGVVAAIIFCGKYLIGPAFRLIAQTRLRELFTAAALLLIIGIALLMTQVGLSPALGTFLAGVVLAQSEYRHELETDIEPFKGLLLGLFFIAVGASIDFSLIAANPGLIALLVAGLILIKFVVLAIVGRVFGMGMDSNFLFTFSLAQGGEFAFVLFSFALQNGVITADVANPLIAAVAISMALTPLLMIINEKLIQPRFGTKEKDSRKQDDIDEQQPLIIAGFGRFGSTIGRFMQANNVQATYLDIDPNNVDLLRKMGLKVFYGDASRHDLLEAAGAHEAQLLIVAVDDSEKCHEIVETAKKHFPNLPVLTRTIGWNDSYEMMEMGVEGFYREYLDSALRMGADALGKMGFRSYQVQRSLKLFRRRDEQMVRELAELRHEQSALIRGSKQRIQDMERLMQDDLNRMVKDKDMGWDATSIKADFGTLLKPIIDKEHREE
ncbi:monovalent cation:proton antiporter-2 (CPA2) family protein [Marinifilum caeruleilacunae]|uniref:Potassium transporter n=1 Tax=Marinifilum caeruleilacunae TaxID=2499076 RepID=A0ABX1WQI4_9BACT|nr:monovalent cation:proton antiporter-2 (CPA2) family protein [Marinifilum caeruleilacunae]NOU58352.1 potassium transporter [Marinifilum caeruleilacunae]